MSGNKPTRHSKRVFAISAAFALVALVLMSGSGRAAQDTSTSLPTIVLVHGDWADESSWNAEIQPLRDRGFRVLTPPNPLRGPSPDARSIRNYLTNIAGPIVLVAHSYGGFVATNAARGVANVKALVYIDAFVPDDNETLAGLLATSGSCIVSAGAFKPVPFIVGVDLYLRWEANLLYPGFRACFANGVDEKTSAALHAGQHPASAAQLIDPSGPPAWKSVPSWALLGTHDNVIPPALQERMYGRAGARITRVEAGHLSLVSHPDDVVRVITSAVEATS